MKLVKDLRPTKKAVTTAWAEPGAHFNIRYYGATEDVEALSGDIVNGAIAFRSEEFTKGQLVALKHLATPGLLSPRVGQETILRLGQISWFPIEMTVLTGAPALAIPTADFEPNDMHVALSRLALTRFEYDQQIQGFTMAVTLLCQKKRGYIIKPSEEHQKAAPEAQRMAAFSADRLFEFAIQMGSAISFGMGVALNNLNITGRDLNDYYMGSTFVDASGADSALNFMLSSPNQNSSSGGDVSAVPPIFRQACAQICLHTQLVITPLAFRFNFNGGYGSMTGVSEDSHWSAVYGFRIPYVLHPFAFSAILTNWPACYAIFSRLDTFDISRDMVLGGVYSGWYAYKGDRTYLNTIEGTGPHTPARFIPYGLAVLNAAAQALKLDTALSLSIMRMGPNMDSMTPTGVPQEFAMPAGTWVAALHTIVPGSIPSYDWRTKEKILLRDDMPNNWYTYAVFDQFQRADAAGILLPNASVREQIMETAQLFDPAAYFTVSDSGPQPKKAKPADEKPGSSTDDPEGAGN